MKTSGADAVEAGLNDHWSPYGDVKEGKLWGY